VKTSTIDLLACPSCHGRLTLAGDGQSGRLACARCARIVPIREGIPDFLGKQDLTGSNARFARLYDRLAWLYRPFSWAAFAFIGMPESAARREILDRLEPSGGRVLEVSVGPGVNLPYLVGQPQVGEVFGLDISPGQLNRCRAFVRRRGWPVDLFLGAAEALPFRDSTFESVFHIGGINFFNDKKTAIEEMIRVARPGAIILIADENERGARAYERVIPGFGKAQGMRRPPVAVPVDLIPPGMQALRVDDVWRGWLYCVQFRKPA